MPQPRSFPFYLAILLAGLAAGFSPHFAAAAVPAVTTLAASGQTNTVAQLNGTVNPNGLAAVGWFEWGTSTFDYHQQTAPVDLGNGPVVVGLSNLLGGLTPGMIYHGRLVATNADGLSRGGDVAFGSPRVVLNGAGIVTNRLGDTYTDLGAVATEPPLAMSVRSTHSLVLRHDGTVVSWGFNGSGETTIPAGLSNVVAVASGGNHSLALRNDGTVVAWGDNSFGQRDIPAGLGNVVAIAAGESHSLALRGEGTVVAWGNNLQGQSTIPAGLSNVVAIACGDVHSLALRSDGTVVAWGANDNGQAIAPAGLSNVVAIAGGGFHSLALRSDGTVVAWGDDETEQTEIPDGLSNVVAIAGGVFHSLALRGDGTVVGWGTIEYGVRTIPAGLSNVVAVAAGYTFNLALQRDGTLVAWGEDLNGQTTVPAAVNTLPVSVSGNVDVNTLGSYLLTYTSTSALGGVGFANRTVVVLPPLPTVLTLPASGQSNAVAQLNGTVNPNGFAAAGWFEWGTSAFDHGQHTAPVVLGGGSVAADLSSLLTGLTPGAIYHGRIVATNAGGLSRGSDVAFGSPQVVLNDAATLTNGPGDPYTELGAVAMETPLAVVAGGNHSLALRSDGRVVGWGKNDSGQTTIPAGLGTILAIAGGGNHSLALRSDGTVVGWGTNNYGQTDIPAGLSNVEAIAAGGYHSLALRSDGTVAAWGRNDFGQSTIPVEASNVVAIAAGGYHSLALRNDGTVVGWGSNGFRQRTIPAGASNVVAVAAGLNHSLALRSDGTAVGWGDNSSGQRTIPATLSNVVAVAAGGSYNLALRSDGKVVGWGDNGYGQTTIPAGLSNVVAIAGGANHSLAMRNDGTVVGWGGNGVGQTTIPAGLSTLEVKLDGTVDVNTPGSYTLTYTSINALGGVGSVTRTVIIVSPAYPPMLIGTDLNRLGNGAFQFSFVNAPGLSFRVWGSPDPTRSLSLWSDLGPAVEIPSGSGRYQFSDPLAPGNPQGFFYRVSSP